MIGFIAEVGDIGRFTDIKQIQKLVGLKIVKKNSGKKDNHELKRGAEENYEEQCMN